MTGEHPLPPEQEAWRERYIRRMISAGIDEQDAEANFDACGFGPDGFDLEDDPEQCADDEMSYWDDDGE